MRAGTAELIFGGEKSVFSAKPSTRTAAAQGRKAWQEAPRPDGPIEWYENRASFITGLPARLGGEQAKNGGDAGQEGSPKTFFARRMSTNSRPTSSPRTKLRLLRAFVIRSACASAGIFAALGQTSSFPPSSRLAPRHRLRSAIPERLANSSNLQDSSPPPDKVSHWTCRRRAIAKKIQKRHLISQLTQAFLDLNLSNCNAFTSASPVP